MQLMTISEALSWQQTLKQRHAELINLRNANAQKTSRYGETTTLTTPTYDAKALDKRVTLLARELRLLNDSIKKVNATTVVPGFDRDDEVLGELD